MLDDNKIVIAVDAMGGDKAPRMVIEGLEIALKKNKELYFRIFGDSAKVMPILKKMHLLQGNYTFTHTDSVVSSHDKPAEALRQGRQSSLRLAINSVEMGEAHAVISAGNTGALMAMSKFVFKTIAGIDRPAITTAIPTRKGLCVMLDLGANAQCNEQQLVQFAVMGDAFAKANLGIAKPRIGLLNIGSEALKGNDLVQNASELLVKHPHLNYCGFAEGDSIFSAKFDVIVTDGFTGNVALKVMEGTAKFLQLKLTQVLKESFFAKIGFALLMLFSFLPIKRLLNEVNPKNYNGAMLAGLNGIAVKSHGSADKISFANAVGVAYNLVIGKVNEKIKEELI
ncbi:Phosphate acyltransferase [Candidatus Hepatincola sp. Pdp]